MSIKNYLIAKYATVVAKYGQRYMSTTCKMLLASFEKAGRGNMSYEMRDRATEWMSVTDTWVDRYILAVALAKENMYRVRGLVLQDVTRDWKPPEYDGLAKGITAGISAYDSGAKYRLDGRNQINNSANTLATMLKDR